MNERTKGEEDMIRRLAAIAFVAGLLASPGLAADTYVFDKAHSEAAFQVRHIVTRVRGKFADITGTIQVDKEKPETSSVEFVAKTASVDTGVADRDKHLRSADFFDVEKFPEMTFKSTRIKAAGQDRYEVTGILTLHGVQKELTLPVTFLGFAKDPWGNEKAGFETQVTLNRKDFGMVWNKTLDNGGVFLGDEVYVTVNVEANKQKPEAAK
jgi:polyisoprenoid-binding protein YceI